MNGVAIVLRLAILFVVYLLFSVLGWTAPNELVGATFIGVLACGLWLLFVLKGFDLSGVKNQDILKQIQWILQSRKRSVWRFTGLCMLTLLLRYLVFPEWEVFGYVGSVKLSTSLLLAVLYGLVIVLFLFWGYRLRRFQREIDDRIAIELARKVRQ